MTDVYESRCIEFDQTGNPQEVLRLGRRRVDARRLAAGEALVRWLAAPVNPLDVNKVSGTYAFPVRLPAIAGSEAVGLVEKVGADVRHLAAGDRVVPIRDNDMIGVWTQLALLNADNLMKIEKDIDLVSAATLCINPPTAFLMLTKFGQLGAGDFVIQNAANSGVGRAVIQIGREFAIRTINLVRNRTDLAALKAELYELGADYVFAESEWTPAVAHSLFQRISRPKLALNGTGGHAALLISSALADGGTMVTYGGMSRRPSEIATAALVYRNIRVVGVMVSRFLLDEANRDEIQGMFKELQQMIVGRRLRALHARFYAFDDFRAALIDAQRGSDGKGPIGEPAKPILLLQDQRANYYHGITIQKANKI